MTLLRRIVRWIGRIAVNILLIVALILLIGSGYQAVAGRMDEARYRPPGQLIDIGGRRLHIHCTGQGSPAVMLEAGLGMGIGTWLKVQEGVSRFTRVCSYDRAGYGWSDAGPLPRTADRVTADLSALLDRAEIPGPVVVVGHSLGGLYLRHFAAIHPEAVAAMVLVDSSHENQDAPNGPVRVAVRIMQATGLHRWIRPTSGDADLDAVYASTKTSAAVNAEFAGIAESAYQVRRARLSLGKKPLIVVTAGRNDTGQWHEMQLDLLSHSGASRRVVAMNSGHGVHEENPALHTGAPVTRSRTNTKPLLLTCATALTRRPFTLMSARIGAAGGS